MRTVAIAQARVGSTRLPGKVLMDLEGKKVLSWVYSALRASAGVDEVVIATSTLDQDNIIADYCALNGIECFRGSESDVLDRFYQCACQYRADIILRLTCDCPFLDPNVVGQVIRLRKLTNADYCSNQPTWSDGLDTECFTFKALEAAWKEATRSSDRDCVTQWIIRNADRFPQEYLICPFPGAHKERWVLDTKEDFELCKAIARRWGKYTPPSYNDIMQILDKDPWIRDFNKGAVRNERFYEGLASEPVSDRTFERSNVHFARATRTIPFGSQTYSKSHLFYPEEAAPLYVSHGDGARIFDVDGNDYVDLVNALLPVVLGYRDPDVDYAVRRQLSAGISFSLATKLEAELSEKLCDIIPCAEMVKFGKSGTDATTAAIRLARSYTGNDHVLVGGYHGWADWSMAVNDEKSWGIPDHVKRVSHKTEYGNRKDLEWWQDCMFGRIAAVIVEPAHDPDYLRWLRQYCSANGIILIFDEIQTGFRYSMGGAQKYFDVTPDLACFGKSMGNGMPISALVGRRDIMKTMSHPSGMFYSGTFFGDTPSMAAALATIKKMEDEKVIDHLWNIGVKIFCGSKGLEYTGLPPLMKLSFKDFPNATAQQLQALFTQEMAQQGVLILNANCVSYAIKEPEVQIIQNAYRHTISLIQACLEEQGLISKLLKGNIKATPLRKSA